MKEQNTKQYQRPCVLEISAALISTLAPLASFELLIHSKGKGDACSGAEAGAGSGGAGWRWAGEGRKGQRQGRQS